MEIRNKEYQKVIEKFPEVISLEGDKCHLLLKINLNNLLEIDFRKYPRKMNANLINSKGHKFNLSRVVSSLRYWNQKSLVTVLEVIEEILLLIDNLKLNQIMIKKEFLDGLIDICQKKHPLKMKGILGVNKGVVSEYIVPSRACTDISKDFEFLGTTCTIPLDFSYEGTFISRPSGDLSTNEKLKETFKRRRFTMLLAHPYNLPNNIKCFDASGRILNHKIID